MSTTSHPVLAVEAARLAACLGGDTATLRAIMSDDCVYVHSSGAAETREAMIGRLEAGTLKYHGLDVVSSSIRDYGNVVLINGDMHIVVTTGGADKDFVSRYLQVWRCDDGGTWQMISWQSTPLPT
jgi:ketosteroid isomerase-like protein